jgi:hypothetical protein
MAAQLVTCELTQAPERYQTLFKVLDVNFPHRQDVFRTAWAIVTGHPTSHVCDLLSPHLTVADRLVVVPLDDETVWSGLPRETADWLRENVLPAGKR